MENANSTDYLEKIKRTVIENIRRTGKPSVEALSETPRTSLARGMESDDEDEEDDLDADKNADQRVTQRQRDKMVVADNEFDDPSDDEDYKNGLGVRRQPGENRRRGIMSFQNPDALPDEVETDGPRGLNGESGRTTSQASPARGRRSESRASSRPAANGTTPTVAADEDGDVDMEDATPMENGTPIQEMQEDAPSAPQDAAPAQSVAASTEATAQNAAASTSTDASPSGVVTPPDSPATAPAAAAPAPTSAPADSETPAAAEAPATEDVEMGEQADEDALAEAIQKEKDEGLKERTEEGERAEAETEAKAEK